MKKLLKFVILALITTVIVCGCVFVGVYASEEENGSTDGGSDSSTDGSSDSSTDSSTDSNQPASDYEGEGSGTLALGTEGSDYFLSWASTSAINAITYNDTTTRKTASTVMIGATTYTATSVTAAVNPDIYDELETVGALEGVEDSVDITSTFNMASVFDNLIYYDDDNMTELAKLLSGYYTAGTPLIVITSTYNKSYATFGLLVDVEGMYYTITWTTEDYVIGSILDDDYLLLQVTLSKTVKTTIKDTVIEFTVNIYKSAWGSDYYDEYTLIKTGELISYFNYTVGCSISINYTDGTSSVSYTKVSEETYEPAAEGKEKLFKGTYSFTMPAADITVTVAPTLS